MTLCITGDYRGRQGEALTHAFVRGNHALNAWAESLAYRLTGGNG
jgi:hypothetical protein